MKKYDYKQTNNGLICLTNYNEEIKPHEIVTIPDSFEGFNVNSIGPNFFKEIEIFDKDELYNRLDYKNQSVDECVQIKTNDKFSLHTNVTEICEDAFKDIDRIEELKCTDNTIAFGKDCCSNCNRLTNLYVNDNFVIEKCYGEKKPLFLNINLLSIKENTSLNETMFSGFKSSCDVLINLNMPVLSSICEDTFNLPNHCKVASISFKDGLETIEKRTFYKLRNLCCLRLPKTLKHIDDDAFGDCEHLLFIYYGGTQDEWNSLLKDCPTLEEQLENVVVICDTTFDTFKLENIYEDNFNEYSLTSFDFCYLNINNSGAILLENYGSIFEKNQYIKLLKEKGLDIIGVASDCFMVVTGDDTIYEILLPKTLQKIGPWAFMDFVDRGGVIYFENGNANIDQVKKDLLNGDTPFSEDYFIFE